MAVNNTGPMVRELSACSRLRTGLECPVTNKSLRSGFLHLVSSYFHTAPLATLDESTTVLKCDNSEAIEIGNASLIYVSHVRVLILDPIPLEASLYGLVFMQCSKPCYKCFTARSCLPRLQPHAHKTILACVDDEGDGLLLTTEQRTRRSCT